MWYLAQVFRDENGDIIERRLMGKSEKFELTSKQEHVILHDQIDHDIELSKVEEQNGELVIVEDADKIAAQNAEVEIALRIKRIAFGQRLIAIMSIRNDAKNLTPAEIVQLVTNFSDINTAWLNGSILTSRSLVNALTPDEDILTSADKTAILAEIDANLVSLGYEV
jgi:hypothetical protein